MKRIALFGWSAAAAAGIFTTAVLAAEPADTPKPPVPPTADAGNKQGCEPGRWQRGGGPGRFGRHGGPGGDHRPGRPEGFGPRGPGGPMGWDHMLNLTDEQKAKLKEIMEANKPKIEAIRKEEMAKIRAVMDDSMKQLEPLLTADQKQVLADMQKLRQSREKLDQDKKTEQTQAAHRKARTGT